MKKISLLVFALVVLLPGCGKKQETASQPVRKNTVEKYMQTDGDIVELGQDENGADEIDFDDIDADELDELLKSIEEGDEYAFGDTDEDSDEDLVDIMVDEDSDSDELAFNWVDSQSDDEFKKLYFSFNHYGIRADQKDAVSYDIEQVKQLIAEAGTAQPTVVIEGHACQEGTPDYNLVLSEKRAKNVADIFVAAGVDKNLIKVIGRGRECPVVMNGKAVNGSRDERAPNRRVEVRVIYT